MNKIVQQSLIGAGALGLFAASYVGIALVSGAPLHEVAVIDQFVDAPEVPEGAEGAGAATTPTTAATTDASAPPEPTGNELLEANAGLLGAFMIESPFTAAELRKLEGELKRKLREMTIEREALQVQSLELDEWETSLRERQAELADLRTKLEALESSIELRMAELARDEAAHRDRELQGWKDLAKLYKTGEAEVNARMLAEESPEDAALILRELGEEQAGEILRLMNPLSVRQKYADAYRATAKVAEE